MIPQPYAILGFAATELCEVSRDLSVQEGLRGYYRGLARELVQLQARLCEGDHVFRADNPMAERYRTFLGFSDSDLASLSPEGRER